MHNGSTTRRVAVLFPGQGAQRPGMAVGLYRRHAGFRVHLDEVFELWGPEGAAVRADWLAEHPVIAIDDLRRAQPLLFGIGWALGRCLLDRGLVPDALLGHSVGEVVAATLAGVLSLPDAVRMMRERVARLAAAPPGGMLAVHATPEQVAPFLTDEVVIGAVNGPRQLLLAGPDEPLRAVEVGLRAAQITCRRARSATAFHSPAVATAAAEAEPMLRTVSLRAPRLPLYSCYTGTLLSARLAADPRYWARQPAAPVLFGAALDALLATGPYLVVEAGAPHGLTTLVRRHPAVRHGGTAAVALLPARPGSEADDLAAFDAVSVTLAAYGAPIPGRGAVFQAHWIAT